MPVLVDRLSPARLMSPEHRFDQFRQPRRFVGASAGSEARIQENLPIGRRSGGAPRRPLVPAGTFLSTIKSFTSSLKDAFRRAIKGGICALWIPPAATFVYAAISHAFEEINRCHDVLSTALRVLVGCLALAGAGFILGALSLLVVGIPVLFCLTLLRANHPVVVCTAGAAWPFWRFAVSPTAGSPFEEGTIMLTCVAATTAFAAARYARSNPRARSENAL
jgi:hypothetical protein